MEKRADKTHRKGRAKWQRGKREVGKLEKRARMAKERINALVCGKHSADTCEEFSFWSFSAASEVAPDDILHAL